MPLNRRGSHTRFFRNHPQAQLRVGTAIKHAHGGADQLILQSGTFTPLIALALCCGHRCIYMPGYPFC
jgi:hypothetical protein